jgi:YD repeat-containing protein
MAGNLLVTTYSAWDPLGRPTAAIVSSRASTINLQYKYDDALRTMTTTNPVGVQVDTYDADGNMTREEAIDGSGKTTYSIKINKTEKVCK